MNDDKFIDEALKEHARHEGACDRDFLKELEARLAEKPDSKIDRQSRDKEISSKRSAWLSVAAIVLVGCAVGAFFEMKEASEYGEIADSPLVNYSVSSQNSEFTTPPEPKIATSTERKPSKPASEIADEIDAKLYPVHIPVPEHFGRDSSKPFNGSFDDGLVSSGWGDGDEGHSGGGFGSIPIQGGRGNKYGTLIERGFLSPLQAPLSTFSVDVDTASYTNIRRNIEDQNVIDPDAVRIEEMINYFDYQYPKPAQGHPFSVHTEVSDCPWNRKHRLVKIGLQGKEIHEDRKAANLVFLIDGSGSMKSPDKLPLLVKSFEILVSSLNENDRVSLVVYAGRQAILLKPTFIDGEGRRAVTHALKKLSTGGGTNGAAGISTAYDLARSGFIEGGVNRVVLATDGDFNVGTTNQEELLKLVKNQAEGKISLTILGFGQGNLNDDLMEQLTNHGDGNYFYLDSLREGQKVFQRKLTGTIETIAKDVKIQVEFNPGKVSRYRLIGYANRRLKDEDFTNDKIDAGDIGAGHTVTALYEIVPGGAEVSAVVGDLKYQKAVEEEPARKVIDSPESLTVKFRYKLPDGEVSTELVASLTDNGATLTNASDDFRFASSVALWGMLLGDSEYAVEGTVEMVEKLALGALGDDRQGDRAEFLDLVRKWSSEL